MSEPHADHVDAHDDYRESMSGADADVRGGRGVPPVNAGQVKDGSVLEARRTEAPTATKTARGGCLESSELNVVAEKSDFAANENSSTALEGDDAENAGETVQVERDDPAEGCGLERDKLTASEQQEDTPSGAEVGLGGVGKASDVLTGEQGDKGPSEDNDSNKDDKMEGTLKGKVAPRKKVMGKGDKNLHSVSADEDAKGEACSNLKIASGDSKEDESTALKDKKNKEDDGLSEISSEEDVNMVLERFEKNNKTKSSKQIHKRQDKEFSDSSSELESKPLHQGSSKKRKGRKKHSRKKLNKKKKRTESEHEGKVVVRKKMRKKTIDSSSSEDDQEVGKKSKKVSSDSSDFDISSDSSSDEASDSSRTPSRATGGAKHKRILKKRKRKEKVVDSDGSATDTPETGAGPSLQLMKDIAHEKSLRSFSRLFGLDVKKARIDSFSREDLTHCLSALSKIHEGIIKLEKDAYFNFFTHKFKSIIPLLKDRKMVRSFVDLGEYVHLVVRLWEMMDADAIAARFGNDFENGFNFLSEKYHLKHVTDELDSFWKSDSLRGLHVVSDMQFTIKPREEHNLLKSILVENHLTLYTVRHAASVVSIIRNGFQPFPTETPRLGLGRGLVFYNTILGAFDEYCDKALYGNPREDPDDKTPIYIFQVSVVCGAILELAKVEKQLTNVPPPYHTICQLPNGYINKKDSSHPKPGRYILSDPSQASVVRFAKLDLQYS